MRGRILAPKFPAQFIFPCPFVNRPTPQRVHSPLAVPVERPPPFLSRLSLGGRFVRLGENGIAVPCEPRGGRREVPVGDRGAVELQVRCSRLTQCRRVTLSWKRESCQCIPLLPEHSKELVQTFTAGAERHCRLGARIAVPYE